MTRESPLAADAAALDAILAVRPILNSAAVAALFEGLAADLDSAAAMIRGGEIDLVPAQDFGVVTPPEPFAVALEALETSP